MTVGEALMFPSLPPGAPGPRDALVNASLELEALSTPEQRLLDQGLSDLADGLVYSHDHVRRLAAPDWARPPRPTYASPGAMRVEWTRTGDMSHLGDPTFERRAHEALEAFAATGLGKVWCLGEDDVYRLHVGDLRILFKAYPRKLTVLAVQRRERPSRTAPRSP